MRYQVRNLWGCVLLTIFLGGVQSVYAQTLPIESESELGSEAEMQALVLADHAEEKKTSPHDWTIFTEAARTWEMPRNDGAGGSQDRLSLDMIYNARWGRDWRGVLSNRTDIFDVRDRRHTVNTLREAYVSRESVNWSLDVGRINARYGLGIGYNPSDFLRTQAIRALVSTDPLSMRQNRMGTVMLRGQALWAGGGVTALVAPKLGTQPSDAGFNLDWGATNRRDQALMSVSHEWWAGFRPEVLVWKAAGESVQWGMNVSSLMNSAMLAYLEWSGGRTLSLREAFAMHPAQFEPTQWHHRVNTGVRYSTPWKATLTLEWHGNDAAASAQEWEMLRQGNVRAYQHYRQGVGRWQEMPTRSQLFTHIKWEDALMAQLDVSAYWRQDLTDRSHSTWAELRYHWQSSDLALRVLLNQGASLSNFGGLPIRRSIQLMWVKFL